MRSRLLAIFFLCAASYMVSQSPLTDTAHAGLARPGVFRSAEEGWAAAEFRRGVQAYYRGAFNEAILQFERALSYLPDDNLIIDWLGKAYYRAGFEGTALTHWRQAAESGYGGLLLQNKIELVSELRAAGSLPDVPARYTEAGSFPGRNGAVLVYSGPTAVLPNSDGSFWAVAYGSNEVLRIDVNGTVVMRNRGPLNGFDRPLDIIRLRDGNLLVSESAGDRLSLLDAGGRFIRYIGATGRGVGQCVGPQYLAEDGNGNILVTDYGNRRVTVFASDGSGLFSFGRRSNDFSGLEGPAGIAVIDTAVFVADNVTGAIHEFDTAGNYRRALVAAGTLSRPESIKVWDSQLVVCDSNRVLIVDAVSGEIAENARTGNAPSRLTSAVPDINGNVLVTDYTANEIYVMARIQELIGGFSVQIVGVHAEQFPTVVLDVQIENRRRQPVVGLGANNFYISEGRQPVANQLLLGAASNNTVADITIVLDRSALSDRYRAEMENAVREIAVGMNGQGTLRIVAAGKTPSLEFAGNPESAREFRLTAIKTPVATTVPLDIAFRLAANELVTGQPRRAIIYVTAGGVTQDAFAEYSLTDSAAYLNNNAIAFSVVQLARYSMAEEIAYLRRTVPGKTYYVYRPEGLSSVIADTLSLPSGRYQFSYTSSLQTNFGEAYIPVEIEAYLMNRSGRDETGYFAPLH
ncbi:MAG: hypothetical protein IJ191_02715 [Treponema sp.]|nr:hypothetical protein [Treponema sp.]